MAETSSGEKAREINSVGLVKSKSSGAFISIFTKGSVSSIGSLITVLSNIST